MPKFSREISFVPLTLLLLLAMIPACRDNSETQKSKTLKIVKDDRGKEVRLPIKVTRAVSLAPNLTEIVFAVDGEEYLVGVTTICDYPGEAKKIKKVGDTLKPNIENIIALKPQVVLVSTASQLEAFTETLEKSGIEVFVSNPATLEDIFRSIEKVGEIFGKTDRASAIVKGLKERVLEAEKKTKGVEKIRTFVQIDQSPFTIGKGSFLTDMVEKAGGVSVTKDVEKPYFKVSKETALALNPEAIIISESIGNEEPNEVFKQSDAVRNGKVFKVNSDVLSRPAPRVVDAIEQMAKSLHPEKFQ